MKNLNTLFTIGVLVFVLIIILLAYKNYMQNKIKNPANEQALEQSKETVATIYTNKGKIKLRLFQDKAPKTVENFVKLADSGFYNGVRFHRVIKGFMIQAGDPLTKDESKKALWGTGGPGYTFEDEIYPGNSNAKWTIAMANAGPNTNGSQFFINTADNFFLNSKHTVFGEVTDGFEVVQAIENTPTGERDIPQKDIIIEKIEIQ